MLNINPSIVCDIILYAKEFHAKEGATFEEEISDSGYEYERLQILADHKDDLTYLEVKQSIEDLEPDQKIDLLALLYIGREDFEATEWRAAQREAKRNLSPNLTDYLFAKPYLADYLEKGLNLLGYSCDDTE